MAVRRLSTPDADEYAPREPDLVDEVEDDEEDTPPARTRLPKQREAADAYEDEDEDEVPDRSSLVQAGWAAAKKAMSSNLTTEFKFSEDTQIVAFVDSEPLAFKQHWLDKKEGRKSYVCIGAACPLCRVLGDEPSQKYAFSVLNLSDEGMPAQMLIVGTRLCGTLDKLNSDKKTGPLDKNPWALSKTGRGQKTAYTVLPVKVRDLADDWDLDPSEVGKAIESAQPLGASAIRVSSKAELMEIARDLSE